jgi:hypothetical protein
VRCKGIVLSLAVFVFLLSTASSASAVPPQIGSTSVAGVSATSATLEGRINPNGLVTTYRFEYLPLVAYEANLNAQPRRDLFAGASFAPPGGAGPAGAGVSLNSVSRQLVDLIPETAYRYRLRATNSAAESVVSAPRPFATQSATNVFELLDHRGWEMVSPIEKQGGSVQPPDTISGGGVFQAAVGGGAFTFSSSDSFGLAAQSAPPGSQYVATRLTTAWTTANITTPIFSGSYGSEPDGVPYHLFSADLGLGLLSNGERCRGEAGGECPVANPPLPGTGAPAGYRNYYRRNWSGSFESVLSPGDFSHSTLGPEQFELRLVGATPDLAHLVFSSCAALTAEAVEIAAPGGCDRADQNLYEWSGGSLALINVLPGEVTGTPGAMIAAPSGAISGNGSRVYFVLGGSIYLREGNMTKTVVGTPGELAATSGDGSIAYLIEAGGLEMYSATADALTPLATGPGVEGVLGTSADGTKVYYAESGRVFLRNGASVVEVASSAGPSNWPAATGTARVSADGSHLLFLSEAELTEYPSSGQTEVFLYGPPAGGGPALLSCVSCNPSGVQPQGGAAIPGARANGQASEAINVYKPRNLSADGNRVFFETSDPLASQDTNGAVDVYEWEAGGEGTCARSGGCVQLLSGGRDREPSYFLDADEDGGEAFFLTAASLYPLDPGSYDVYDAREEGGFAVPESPIPCVADACQVLPGAPEDPIPGTLVSNSGNPALQIAGAKSRHKHKKKHRKHRKKARGHHHDRSKKHHGTGKR